MKVVEKIIRLWIQREELTKAAAMATTTTRSSR
jgi:hypothetical protein